MNNLMEQGKNIHLAIRQDDVPRMEQLLSVVPAENRLNYINGTYHQDLLSEKVQSNKRFMPSCLMHLAAIHRAKRCFTALLSQGADATKSDSRGNNILHMMVHGAVAKPEAEDDFCDMLDHIHTLIDIKHLAFIEEEYGLRPLELAYSLGALCLGEKLFTTPGLYLVAAEEIGIYKTQWFDITDYEGFGKGQGSRKMKSPLFHLTRMSTTKLHEVCQNNGLEVSVLTTWIHQKIGTYIAFYIVWLFIRTVFVLGIIFFMKMLPFNIQGEVVNSTITMSTNTDCVFNSYVFMNLQEEVILTSILSSIALAMVAFDICEVVYHFYAKNKYKWMSRKAHANDKFAVNLLGYRVLHFVLAVMVAFHLFVGDDFFIGFEEVSMILTTTLCLWSLFQLLELFPGIGKHIMTYQRLVGDMLYLVVMFLMFIAPYSQLFQKFVNLDGDKVSCPAEYHSIGDSLYSTFTVIVNMVNFRSFDKTAPGSLFLLHFIYVIIVGIMLLNFFIALLSESAAAVGQVRKELSLLLRLNMALTIEHRISWFFQWIITPMQRNKYSYTDGKIYLTVETIDIDYAPKIDK